MKTTNEAISVARQFDRLYVQVMREKRNGNPDRQRIAQWKQAAVKVNARLVRLMAW